MVKQATLYQTDGKVLPLNMEELGTLSYDFLRNAVQGMVEIVPLPDGRSIIVNEEGKLIGLPVNEKVTEEWKKAYPIAHYPHNNDELVAGNAIIATEDCFNQE